MQRRSVLVVEDDAILSALVETSLSQMGYDTRAAYSLTMALDLVQERLPELLILDLALPDGRGWSLLRDIRNTFPESEHPAVLVMSADVSRSELRENDVDNYLAKPFTITDLRELVTELLPMGCDRPTS